MTTNVIANHQTGSLDYEACQELSHWKYWWGIGKSDEILVGPENSDTDCPCRNYSLAGREIKSSLASVEVKSTFWDFTLNLITLGIVNHRTIRYKCPEIDEGEQEN